MTSKLLNAINNDFKNTAEILFHVVTTHNDDTM